MIKYRFGVRKKLSQIRESFKVWKTRNNSSSSNSRLSKKKETKYKKRRTLTAFVLMIEFWLGSPKLAHSSFNKFSSSVNLEKINRGGANFQAEAFEIIIPQVVNPRRNMIGWKLNPLVFSKNKV